MGTSRAARKGQYTNSFKAIFSFKNPVDGGSFHPNVHGQEALARLVACYLNVYPQRRRCRVGRRGLSDAGGGRAGLDRAPAALPAGELNRRHSAS